MSRLTIQAHHVTASVDRDGENDDEGVDEMVDAFIAAMVGVGWDIETVRAGMWEKVRGMEESDEQS